MGWSSVRAANQLSGFGVLIRGTQFALRLGDTIVGRGADCDIVILGPHVSRQHVRLAATRSGVTLFDLGSANGVFVNHERVQEPLPLRDGDRIQIGTEELSLFTGVTESDGVSSFSSAVDLDHDDTTIEGRAPPVPRIGVSHAQRAPTIPLDQELAPGEVSQAAFGIVERILARGDRQAAARALDGQLARALEDARSGVETSRSTLDAAARACASVARATGEATSIDRCLELYIAAQALLSERALCSLEPLWPAPGAECQSLRRYQALVRSRIGRASGPELALLQRILSLGT